MEYYSKTAEFAARQFGSDTVRGLTSALAEKNKTKFGDNRLSRKKKRGLLRRTAEALKELKLEPYIVSESAGTQAEDALEMKRIYTSVCAAG